MFISTNLLFSNHNGCDCKNGAEHKCSCPKSHCNCSCDCTNKDHKHNGSCSTGK